MPEVIDVTFEPGGRTVQVPRGTLISEAAQATGLSLATPCGGKGLCGQCQVIIQSGKAGEPTEAEREHLSPEQLSQGMRLACQARVMDDAVIYVPATGELIADKSLKAEMVRSVAVEPHVRREWLRLAEPTLDDQRSDFRRIADAVADRCPQLTADPLVLRELPATIRAADYQVAITTRGGKLVSVHPSDAAPPYLGAAVDIGTSTVAVYLVDLQTGQQLASVASANSQAQYGADVISRIEYANTHTEGREQLRNEVVALINELIAEATDRIGADRQQIYEVTVVGNTCMHHLFLGLDPQHLAQAPYIPVTSEPMNLSATEAGLAIHPQGNIFCLPCIAGFVGADTVGVIAASEMTRRQQPVLAVDIGTNGEIALWSGEALLVASCAAGPAFEGAQIQQGMRAAPGAIDHVVISNGDIDITTIDNQPAVGICGSGLLDGVAVLLELGVVDTSGRFMDGQGSSGLSEAVVNRLEGEGNERRIILANHQQTSGSPVALTQRDVRELQLAKGAIRATIDMLLDYVGLAPEDLDEVLIAGAFGNYIKPDSALRIGLLPQMPPEKVRGVGNAAGAGAILALISAAERTYTCQVAEIAQHIELFRQREFQEIFAERMLFV